MSQNLLKAQEPVYGGYVLHRAEGESITFIKGAVPGELVEVSIQEKKRDYSVGTVVEVVEPSPYRREPACEYFGSCGGCQLQFITYPRQVELKDQVVRDCLKRLGGIEIALEHQLFGEPFGYRRRGQFKVSREGSIGLFKEGTREIVPVTTCPLMTGPINEVLGSMRGVKLDGVREIHLTHGDGVVALIKGIPFSETIADELMDAGLEGVAFEDGTYRGTGPSYVLFDLNGLKYSVSPWSFLQSNWDLNRRMVEQLVEDIGSLQDRRLLDMYAGAGNFSIPLAMEARQTVAVEENSHAITDGQRNAAQNRISGYTFIKGTAEAAKLKGEFDVLVLDPPRPGLSKPAMERVLALAAPRVAYISCNPSTLARDLKIMSEMYVLDSVQVADMFPNTYHIECLALLTIK